MKKLTTSTVLLFLILLSKTSFSQGTDTTIVKELNAGWNIVGYMGQTPVLTQIAFESIMDKIITIKNLDGYYTPEQEEFLNSLDSLIPLDGVLIEVSEDCTLERTIKKSAILYTVSNLTLAEILRSNNDGNGYQIKNIGTPTDTQDAITKDYLDIQILELLETIEALEQRISELEAR